MQVIILYSDIKRRWCTPLEFEPYHIVQFFQQIALLPEMASMIHFLTGPNEVFIPIRISHHDKTFKDTQLYDLKRYIIKSIGEAQEFYAARKLGVRDLCGSI